MNTYKALLNSNMKVYFTANSNVEAAAIAKRLGADKLIRKVAPTKMEFVSYV